MGKFIETGAGVALAVASVAGITATGAETAFANSADISYSCFDGTGYDTNPEAVVHFIHMGDQVGKDVLTFVNGELFNKHNVTAKESHFDINVQSGIGPIDISTEWSGKKHNFTHVIEACVAVTTVPVDTQPVETTPDTTTTAVVVTPPASNAVTTTSAPVVEVGQPPVPTITRNTLPKTGFSAAEKTAKYAVFPTVLGGAALVLTRRKRPATQK